MASEFNRILALLRKERGITQKQAAADLGISQAQLSHYEKGIRECSLAFVVQVADYYGVSCDYLLGRSADRSGQTISVADLPETGASTSGSVRITSSSTFISRGSFCSGRRLSPLRRTPSRTSGRFCRSFPNAGKPATRLKTANTRSDFVPSPPRSSRETAPLPTPPV